MGLEFSLNQCNRLGGILAIALYLLTIGIFVARLGNRPWIEHWLGLVMIILIIPLTYLLVSAFYLDRPRIYFLWIGLMIFFLLVELLLDYILELPFRTVRWQAIAYVMLFFGATGGMLGVASLAGRGWSVAAVAIFLVMAALAFIQRSITGM
jgi:hypothetical protein